jgi:hypothetical protein
MSSPGEATCTSPVDEEDSTFIGRLGISVAGAEEAVPPLADCEDSAFIGRFGISFAATLFEFI